jgi:hypothetical protein
VIRTPHKQVKYNKRRQKHKQGKPKSRKQHKQV